MRGERQTAFNLKWRRELLADPNLARLPHRVETNRHGHILEVLSSSNTPEEISEKIALYFESGAQEVDLRPRNSPAPEKTNLFRLAATRL